MNEFNRKPEPSSRSKFSGPRALNPGPSQPSKPSSVTQAEAVRGRTPQKEAGMVNNHRSYEIMFIVRPDVDETELDKLIETFSGYVTDGGGKVTNSLAEQKMGRRRLAYTVKKFNDGFYILLVVEAPAAADCRNRAPPPRL